MKFLEPKTVSSHFSKLRAHISIPGGRSNSNQLINIARRFVESAWGDFCGNRSKSQRESFSTNCYVNISVIFAKIFKSTLLGATPAQIFAEQYHLALFTEFQLSRSSRRKDAGPPIILQSFHFKFQAAQSQETST